MGKLLKLLVFQVVWLCVESNTIKFDAGFEKDLDQCVDGVCPWCFPPADFYGKCEQNGRGHRYGHINDCKKYYICEQNPDECASAPWGRSLHNCPAEQYFDVVERECVASEDCPQMCPPIADEKIGCNPEGIAPEDDCRSGIGCIPVETCPGHIYETYWTSGKVTCTGEDEYFHAKFGKCTKAMACPQLAPEENCRLKWDLMGEKAWNCGIFEVNVSFCRVWVKGEYLYGRFSEKDQECELEKSLDDTCCNYKATKYEVLSADNNLTIFSSTEREKKIPNAATLYGKKKYFASCNPFNHQPATRSIRRSPDVITHALHHYAKMICDPSWYEFLC